MHVPTCRRSACTQTSHTQGDLLFGMHAMAPFELKPNDQIFILVFTAFLHEPNLSSAWVCSCWGGVRGALWALGFILQMSCLNDSMLNWLSGAMFVSRLSMCSISLTTLPGTAFNVVEELDIITSLNVLEMLLFSYLISWSTLHNNTKQ